MNFQLRKLYILTAFIVFSGWLVSSAMAQNLGERERIVREKNPSLDVEDTSKKKTEIQLNFSNENLTNGYGDWRTVSLDFKRSFENRAVFYGSVQESRRNNLRDGALVLGLYQPINKKWSVNIEGTVSPTHKFVGKYSGTAKVERIFSKGWVGSVGVRHSQFNAVQANSALFSGEKYWSNYRAAYMLNVTHLQNAGTSAGNAFSFNKYYGEENSSLGVSYGFGRELENTGTRILQSNTQSLNLSVRHWLNSRWGITADASINKQDKLYYRRGINVGMRFRF